MKLTGWCYTGNGEFGYCSEINDLPDTPDAVHPLLEVQTFILPKEVSTTYTKYLFSTSLKNSKYYEKNQPNILYICLPIFTGLPECKIIIIRK